MYMYVLVIILSCLGGLYLIYSHRPRATRLLSSNSTPTYLPFIEMTILSPTAVAVFAMDTTLEFFTKNRECIVALQSTVLQ